MAGVECITLDTDSEDEGPQRVNIVVNTDSRFVRCNFCVDPGWLSVDGDHIDHRLRAHGSALFYCDACQDGERGAAGFETIKEISKHVVKENGLSPTDTVNICDLIRIPRKPELLKIFRCTFCPGEGLKFVGLSEEAFLTHVKNRHGLKAPRSRPDKLRRECRVCGEGMKTNEELTRHIIRRHLEKGEENKFPFGGFGPRTAVAQDCSDSGGSDNELAREGTSGRANKRSRTRSSGGFMDKESGKNKMKGGKRRPRSSSSDEPGQRERRKRKRKRKQRWSRSTSSDGSSDTEKEKKTRKREKSLSVDNMKWLDETDKFLSRINKKKKIKLEKESKRKISDKYIENARNERSTSNEELDRRSRTPKLLNCDLCNENEIRDMQKHLSRFHQDMTFLCTLCEEVFPDIETAADHLERDHDRSGDGKSLLKTGHIQPPSCLLSIICCFCHPKKRILPSSPQKFMYEIFDHMGKHEVKHKGVDKVINLGTDYSCRICVGRVWRDLNSLNDHVNKRHKKIELESDTMDRGKNPVKSEDRNRSSETLKEEENKSKERDVKREGRRKTKSGNCGAKEDSYKRDETSRSHGGWKEENEGRQRKCRRKTRSGGKGDLNVGMLVEDGPTTKLSYDDEVKGERRRHRSDRCKRDIGIKKSRHDSPSPQNRNRHKSTGNTGVPSVRGQSPALRTSSQQSNSKESSQQSPLSYSRVPYPSYYKESSHQSYSKVSVVGFYNQQMGVVSSRASIRDPSLDLFQCQKCRIKTEDRYEMLEHMKDGHGLEENLTVLLTHSILPETLVEVRCKFCAVVWREENIFLLKSLLRKHQNEKHRDIFTSLNGCFDLECRVCSTTFPINCIQDMVSHTARHSGGATSLQVDDSKPKRNYAETLMRNHEININKHLYSRKIDDDRERERKVSVSAVSNPSKGSARENNEHAKRIEGKDHQRSGDVSSIGRHGNETNLDIERSLTRTSNEGSRKRERSDDRSFRFERPVNEGVRRREVGISNSKGWGRSDQSRGRNDRRMGRNYYCNKRDDQVKGTHRKAEESKNTYLDSSNPMTEHRQMIEHLMQMQCIVSEVIEEMVSNAVETSELKVKVKWQQHEKSKTQTDEKLHTITDMVKNKISISSEGGVGYEQAYERSSPRNVDTSFHLSCSPYYMPNSPSYPLGSPCYMPSSPSYPLCSPGYSPGSSSHPPCSPGYTPSLPAQPPCSPDYTLSFLVDPPRSPDYMRSSPARSLCSPGYTTSSRADPTCPKNYTPSSSADPPCFPDYITSSPSHSPCSPDYTPSTPANPPCSPGYAHNSPAHSPCYPDYMPSIPFHPPCSPTRFSYSPGYTPFTPALPPCSPGYAPNSPARSPCSPGNTPSSPSHSPCSLGYTTSSPTHVPSASHNYSEHLILHSARDPASQDSFSVDNIDIVADHKNNEGHEINIGQCPIEEAGYPNEFKTALIIPTENKSNEELLATVETCVIEVEESPWDKGVCQSKSVANFGTRETSKVTQVENMKVKSSLEETGNSSGESFDASLNSSDGEKEVIETMEQLEEKVEKHAHFRFIIADDLLNSDAFRSYMEKFNNKQCSALNTEDATEIKEKEISMEDGITNDVQAEVMQNKPDAEESSAFITEEGSNDETIAKNCNENEIGHGKLDAEQVGNIDKERNN